MIVWRVWMTQAVYRWYGEYFGFIWMDRLFDKSGNYVAWIDGKEVWKKDGTYLGELVENRYVLRATKKEPRPACKPGLTLPDQPKSVAACQDIEPRPLKEDYTDALNEY
jgi:hypothetical protein